MVAVDHDDDLWVGVDLGTQGVRVMIVAGCGRPVALGAASLASARPHGSGRRHEQDPAQWWEAVGVASRQACAGLRDVAAIRGIAVCSTSGTVALTDATGMPVTHALMYDDARASDELARIKHRAAGIPDHAAVQVSWALPKISWLLNRYAFGEASTQVRVGHSADIVAALLVGRRVATDSSHALKSGYDAAAQRWNTALLAAADIDVDLMPEVVSPGSELGVVTPAAAEHTGIPAGTPVLAGMTDGCAAQIAAGALTPGAWNSVLGTTLVLKGVSARAIVDPAGAVYNHRHPDQGWLPGGASNVGAGIVSREFGDRDLARLDLEAAAYLPAGLVRYPLGATGERFPFVRPDAEPFELGVATSEAERFAALLQGVAFVERLCFERLAELGAPVHGDIAITGGGAKSEQWNQLRADVLNRPLTIPATPEPAFGMAVLASAGGHSVTDRAKLMVGRRQVIEPRPRVHDRLADAYDKLRAELDRRGYLAAPSAAPMEVP